MIKSNPDEAEKLFQAVVKNPQAPQDMQINAKYYLGLLMAESNTQEAKKYFQEIIDDQQASQGIQVKAKNQLELLKSKLNPQVIPSDAKSSSLTSEQLSFINNLKSLKDEEVARAL